MSLLNLKTTFSFTKRQRLLNSKAFTTVFTTPSFKIHQPNLLFFVRLLDDSKDDAKNVSGLDPASPDHIPSESRLGLAITKKKIKRANQRNRVKRLSREYFRLNQHTLVQPVEIVIIIKHFPLTLTNAEIYGQLEAAFHQINRKISISSAK